MSARQPPAGCTQLHSATAVPQVARPPQLPHDVYTCRHSSSPAHLLALLVPLLRLVGGEDDAAHGGAGGGGQALAQHRVLVLRLAGACNRCNYLRAEHTSARTARVGGSGAGA